MPSRPNSKHEIRNSKWFDKSLDPELGTEGLTILSGVEGQIQMFKIPNNTLVFATFEFWSFGIV